MSDTMDDIVNWMRKRGVRSFSRSMPAGESVSIELGPEPVTTELQKSQPVAPVPAVFEDTDGAGVCACGHSWLEHTAEGCLHGCSHEVCTSTGTPEPKDGP